MTWITGNTYPNRHVIKPLGFTWNKRAKAWERTLPLTPEEEETLTALPGIVVDYGSLGVVIDTRPERPLRSYKQTYGRCEDAPCCGCCGPQFY